MFSPELNRWFCEDVEIFLVRQFIFLKRKRKIKIRYLPVLQTFYGPALFVHRTFYSNIMSYDKFLRFRTVFFEILVVIMILVDFEILFVLYCWSLLKFWSFWRLFKFLVVFKIFIVFDILVVLRFWYNGNFWDFGRFLRVWSFLCFWSFIRFWAFVRFWSFLIFWSSEVFDTLVIFKISDVFEKINCRTRKKSDKSQNIRSNSGPNIWCFTV